MDATLGRFVEAHADEIARDADGSLRKDANPIHSIASERILSDMMSIDGLSKLEAHGSAHVRLSQWVMAAPIDERIAAGLSIDVPAPPVHFVPGLYPIFYDFKNTDLVLDPLPAAGVEIRGSLLDFGCSSGRNLAVLRRAFGPDLELIGADPAQASIDWLNRHVTGTRGVVSGQTPPLPFDDQTFDLVIAKSIWTHFSPAAGGRWFDEIKRILKRDGHFLFSTHGPHDIASRILLDTPRPKYERYTGHENWTRDGFLTDLVKNFEASGHYFQAFKEVGHQADLKLVQDADTHDWGLMFLSPRYLKKMLPEGLSIVSRSIGRTGNRHDLYLVRRD